MKEPSNYESLPKKITRNKVSFISGFMLSDERESTQRLKAVFYTVKQGLVRPVTTIQYTTNS